MPRGEFLHSDDVRQARAERSLASLLPLTTEVEQGIRAACRAPAKRLPNDQRKSLWDPVDNAFCKNGGRISRTRHPRVAESLPLINVTYGEDLTMRELAQVIADAVRFTGAIEWDRSKPDETLRKLMDSLRMRGLEYKPKKTLENGLRMIASEIR